jgi:two-component system, OmpR family, phosphate regulon sensor histidine kinase PhoR
VKYRELLRGLAAFAFALAFLSATVAAAFFATSTIYARLGQSPGPLASQIVNLLLGLLFAVLIIWILTYFSRSKLAAKQMGVFSPIIEAMERIAKGDFTVRLEDTYDDRNFVGTLVKSVNTMAVELDQMEKMRQEFISNVSHEIQSPLTSIRGFAQALRNDQLGPADRQHYLTIIETESMRLSKLSDNLLKLAALDAENVALQSQRYRLDRQLRTVVLACEPQWSIKQIGVDLELQELTITADEDMLSQVWTNLIHNGIKFTPAGGSLCIELCQRDGQILCSIADTGIGIAPEDQPLVFERFFKADRSRERALGGSGLGLAIARKIVELHGGTIAISSALGAGTTFTVCLPGQS